MIGGLHFTVGQINPIVGDLDYNASLILNAWKAAPRNNDIIVFPELSLCGYPPEDLVLKPSFVDAVHAHLHQLIAQSVSLPGACIIGLPYRKNGQLYNAALTIANGQVIGECLKRHLPNYGIFDESRVFEAAATSNIVEYKGHRIGIMICEDMWFPNATNSLVTQGAEILIVSNASPFETRKCSQRLDHAKARVHESSLPLLYVNQVGGQDELVFDGGSFALDASGSEIYRAIRFESVVEPVMNSFTPIAERNEAVYQALVLGIRDYVHKNKFPGIVIGLSGGVDSALAAVIAVDAVGAENVHLVMMPSRFTAQESLDDAATLAAGLGCSYEIIPIAAPMEVFESVIPNLTGVAHENMQSRTRGLILMALSNSSGKMVLSTGNKSEMAVGYATLYGDMCGGFNALKDVYKTQVYEMARSKNVIPRRIIDRAPTAELRDGQTDQDSLPDYAVLDTILTGLIEREMSVDDIALDYGYDRALVMRVWEMLDRAEYKRYQSAPGTKITTRAFGRDRRYPMVNGFRGDPNIKRK